MPTRFRRLWFGPLEALIVIAFGTAGFLVWRTTQEAQDVIARETRARTAVRALWESEMAFRTSRRLDADRNGVAEFGSLDDLGAAGLVSGALKRDAQGPFLEVEGYRLEILLPERIDASRRRNFARPGEHPDPRLSEVAFAAVARPAAGGPKALRTFYLDADQRAYVAEGVYDPDRDASPPLPVIELREPKEDSSNEGPIWRRTPFPGPGGGRPVDPLPGK